MARPIDFDVDNETPLGDSNVHFPNPLGDAISHVFDPETEDFEFFFQFDVNKAFGLVFAHWTTLSS